MLDANSKLFFNKCLFRRNKITNFDAVMEAEVNQRIELRRQGVQKQGNSFVLKEI